MNKIYLTHIHNESEIDKYDNLHNRIIVSCNYLAQKYYQKTKGKCFTVEDFIINNYCSHEAIKVAMVA